ncbi:MAG: FecR domain-containing protein [Rhodothermales bacterium]
MNELDHALLLRSLDEELTPEEQARLATLLQDSPAARTEHETYTRMRYAIRDAGQTTFSTGFTDAVMARIEALPAPGLRLVRPTISYPLLAMAASLLILLLFGALWWTTPRTVEAVPGERLTATLPDGSTVELNSGSTLRYRPFFARTARLVTLDGEAFFQVVSDGSPFIVQTHNARVQVLGTRFNVSTRPGLAAPETRVAVEEGRVRVDALRASSAGVELTASQETVVVADTTPPRPPASTALDVTLAWRHGGLAFQGLPLRLAADELGRRYGRHIRITPYLDDVSIGYMQPAAPSLESVLTDICASVNLAYRRTANGYEIYRP